MELNKQTCCIPISIKQELPPKYNDAYSQTVVCLVEESNDTYCTYYHYRDNTWLCGKDEQTLCWTVTHWFKEQQGYFFTPEQLKQIIEDSYEKGFFDFQEADRNYDPFDIMEGLKEYRDEYINSLKLI